MTQPTLMELIAKRKAQSNHTKTLKPAVGRNRYRILPSWRKNGDITFWHDFGQHFVKDGAGQVKSVYVCADRTFGRPCEICDAVGHAITHTIDDLQKKLIESAKANGRVLINVLHVDGPNPNEPQILELAPSVFNGKKGLGGILQLFEDYEDMIHPTKGRDIVIDKAGVGLETAYAVKMVATDCPPVPKSALERLPDIDAFVRQESEEGARRALASVAMISGIPTPAAGYGSYAAPALSAPIAGSMPPTVADYDPDEAALDAMVADAPWVEPAATTVVPPAAVAAVATAVSTGDPDLDALLKDLG